MKNALTIYMLTMSLLVMAQSLPDTDPASMNAGISYRNAPGSSGGWTYNYGTKLSVWGGVNRNFEIMNTNKSSSSTLAFRTYDGNSSQWTNWREFIYKNQNGNVVIGSTTPLAITSKLEVYSGTGTEYMGTFRSDEGIIWLSAAGPSTENPTYGNYIMSRTSNNSTYRDLGLKTASGVPQLLVKTDGNVGIGTNSPSSKLDVNGNIHMNGGLLQFYRSYENYGNVLVLRTKDNNNYGDFRWEAERTNDTSLRNLMFLDGGRGGLGIGTELIPSGYKLAVNGKAIIEEVRVELSESWPDYVFEENYNLRSLKETEAYIKNNKHLPEIPSAIEMEANGIQLGEMNMLLLKKIEELTLYTIQQQKLIEDQGKMIEELKTKLDEKSD